MRKRIALFAGLLGTLVASMGFAVAGTGAYFTDDTSGTVAVNTATVKIGQPTTLSATFDNFLPGDDKTEAGKLTIASTVPVDVWVRSVKSDIYGGGANSFDGGIVNFNNVASADAGNTGGKWVLLASDVKPGTYDLGLHAYLNHTAGNEWQTKTLSVASDVKIIQAGGVI